jgi:hypothetical protein
MKKTLHLACGGRCNPFVDKAHVGVQQRYVQSSQRSKGKPLRANNGRRLI